MENDILYDCAAAYKDLENYAFEFQVYTKNGIENICLFFDDSQFEHLSGIDYLTDLNALKNISSGRLLNKIFDKEITFKTLESSLFIDKPLNHESNENITYVLADRLETLTRLYDFLHNSHHNLKIHYWDNSVLPSTSRPYNSNIRADFLFVFQEQPIGKADSENVCSFFIENSSGAGFAGVSIFPVDLDYSNDGKHWVEQYQILSITEIHIEQGKEISRSKLYGATQEVFDNIHTRQISNDQNRTIKNDLKAVKSKRKAFFQKQKGNGEAAYYKQLSVFKNRRIYTDDMLREVRTRLKSQLEDSHNFDLEKLIKDEISFVDDILNPTQKSQENENVTKENNSVAPPSSNPTVHNVITNRNGAAARAKPTVWHDIASAFNDLTALAVKGLDMLMGKLPKPHTSEKAKRQTALPKTDHIEITRSLKQERPSVIAELKKAKTEIGENDLISPQQYMRHEKEREI